MINNKEAKAFTNLGLIYYESDKLEQSALSYLKSLEIEPNDEETLCNLGMTLSKIKFNDYAKMAYEEAINVNPGNKTVLVNYLLFLLENKQFNKFANILTHASRILDPAEFQTYQKLYQEFQKAVGESASMDHNLTNAEGNPELKKALTKTLTRPAIPEAADEEEEEKEEE